MRMVLRYIAIAESLVVFAIQFDQVQMTVRILGITCAKCGGYDDQLSSDDISQYTWSNNFIGIACCEIEFGSLLVFGQSLPDHFRCSVVNHFNFFYHVITSGDKQILLIDYVLQCVDSKFWLCLEEGLQQ